MELAVPEAKDCSRARRTLGLIEDQASFIRETYACIPLLRQPFQSSRFLKSSQTSEASNAAGKVGEAAWPRNLNLRKSPRSLA
eukprot:scaffold184_cov316-Pinguiococcus_pyrenoidosus.AAC.63